jgi:hypothetical protein
MSLLIKTMTKNAVKAHCFRDAIITKTTTHIKVGIDKKGISINQLALF